MAEALFRCNLCKDGKVYTSDEALKHKEETKKKGQEHASFRMMKRGREIAPL